jgi:hypothetical protein
LVMVRQKWFALNATARRRLLDGVTMQGSVRCRFRHHHPLRN